MAGGMRNNRAEGMDVMRHARTGMGIAYMDGKKGRDTIASRPTTHTTPLDWGLHLHSTNSLHLYLTLFTWIVKLGIIGGLITFNATVPFSVSGCTPAKPLQLHGVIRPDYGAIRMHHRQMGGQRGHVFDVCFTHGKRSQNGSYIKGASYQRFPSEPINV